MHYLRSNTTTYIMSTLVLALVPLGVTVGVTLCRFEKERYRVEEEDGSVTLALVNTLDLLNSSVGDATTGELLEFCLPRYSLRLFP